tara:strand:- start:20097 stop:22118 length:2022 start_codon:yes stop_codon:yes gene_type:complete
MGKDIKILLNKERSAESVNVNTKFNFNVENTNKPLPITDTSVVVSANEQAQIERRESTKYRFYGNITPLISNQLYNDNVKIYTNNNSQLDSIKIQSNDIFDKEGWVGFFESPFYEPSNMLPTNEKKALCEFTTFDPDYNRLRFLDDDGKPNYKMKITYPASTKDIMLIRNTSNITLKDGIPIINQTTVTLNGREYVAFTTAINHGLQKRDEINLYNFIDNTGGNLALIDRSYNVFKLGDDNNKKKNRTFVLDIKPTDIVCQVGTSTIKRVVNDKESEYYVRVFSALTENYTDYDTYPAAYGTSYYYDKVSAFNFITDVDVEGIKDNLGRPLSELFLTVVKNDQDSETNSVSNAYWLDKQSVMLGSDKNRFWTKISGGFLTEKNINVNYNIKAYGDVNYKTDSPSEPPFIWFENIDESDNEFDGDIVEYNEDDLLEKRLENIHHRINTVYRENLKEINDGYGITGTTNKTEGYIYSPHSQIIIREFSSSKNPIVDIQSIINKYNLTNPIEVEKYKRIYNVPDYAVEISPNVFKWRNLLEIGEIDAFGSGVDYPFESGAHYIYLNNRFYMKRQDPPCDYNITAEVLELPAQKEKFENMLTTPTFLNFQILNPDILNSISSGGVSDLSSYNNSAESIEIVVKSASFFGEYELGVRDVPGSCINYNILDTSDIDDEC